MPVKPENRALYPANWPEIRAAIRERAGMQCEHRDPENQRRCKARQYAVGRWVTADRWRLPVGFEHLQRRELRWDAIEQAATFKEARQRAAEIDFDAGEEGPKPIVIVLTVAHLNHDPTDCSPENLALMCQRHHLAHDHEHHRANAQATRRARSGTAELF